MQRQLYSYTLSAMIAYPYGCRGAPPSSVPKARGPRCRGAAAPPRPPVCCADDPPCAALTRGARSCRWRCVGPLDPRGRASCRLYACCGSRTEYGRPDHETARCTRPTRVSRPPGPVSSLSFVTRTRTDYRTSRAPPPAARAPCASYACSCTAGPCRASDDPVSPPRSRTGQSESPSPWSMHRASRTAVRLYTVRP